VGDEGYSPEGSVRLTDVTVGSRPEELVRQAVDAAEIGSWNWHIETGRVEWTPWTYQLFGYKPGAVTSHELFLKQVHEEDRPAVHDWLARAIHERSRTALEFRIDRPDGKVRRLRSTGRVILDEQGHVARMAGIVEDDTDEAQLRAAGPARLVPPPPAPETMTGSLSPRQVAHILGVAQATVKRMAATGGIQFLRSTRKDSRRFAPEHVIEVLRHGSKGPVDFDESIHTRDMAACLAFLMQQLLAGTTFEALLDERVKGAAAAAPTAFISDLLSRLPFMVPDRPRRSAPALLVPLGASSDLEVELIASLLQIHGHEVLRPAGAPLPRQLVELADRVRARVVVLSISSTPGEPQAGAAAAEAMSAARSEAVVVCARAPDRVRLPRGVVRFRSMRELGTALRHG
jgi:PAS domain S-box-containing protein